MDREKADQFYLAQCLDLAKKAKKCQEVPVGALVIDNQSGGVLARAFNLREKLQTPLAHAEILAIHKACKKRRSWRLVGCSLYSTLEPCVMCCGVILQSRMDRVVYSAADHKMGGQSLLQLFERRELNHKIIWNQGLLKEESGSLLQDFFKKKRLNVLKNGGQGGI